jgi:two-component sensor histidine kinase/PAS domain-containing protein
MNLDIPYIIYIVFYILAGSVLTMMTAHIWINRKILKPGLSLLVLCTAWIWFTCQLFEYLITEVEIKLLCNKLQYIGIAFLPAVWIGFCYTFVYHVYRKGYMLAGLFALVSLIWLILIFTNDFHHLMWSRAVLNQNRINIIKTFSPPYYVFIAYIYILVGGGFVFIIQLLRGKHIRQRHALILIAAGALPVLANISEYIFRNTLSYLELTPISFSASSLIVIYFIRLRYFRTIPLAQHSVIESLSDMLILLNSENQIIYLNPAASSLFTDSQTNIIGKHLYTYLPVLKKILKKTPNDSTASEEVMISGATYSASISPIYNWRNILINKVLALRDITRLKETENNLRQMKENLEQMVQERTMELVRANKTLEEEIEVRKKIELKLNESISEKTILLGEIHHRVKNNLQIITSLLKLQQKYIKDKESLDIFNTAISRIQSIAIIHEKLYKSKDLANTNVAEYIRELSSYLLASSQTEEHTITMDININPIYLNLDRSILCGLIINELLLNAIKYAFPTPKSSGEKNKIAISFVRENMKYILSVMDNGIGLAPGFDITTQKTLGMKIVTTLVKQISGTITIDSREGTTITITFPVEVQ